MGNFFKNLFFETEGEDQKQNVNEGAAETAEDINVSNTSGDAPAEGASDDNLADNLDLNTTGDGVFDKKFGEALNQLINENDMPGLDYLELKRALKGMGSVASMDESVAFKSAFASLRAVDSTLTADKILNSVDFYLGLLKTEEEDFEAAMQQQISENVTALKNQAQEKIDENKEILQKIQELNDKMSENQEKAQALNKEAAHAEININQTHKNFVKTISSVREGMISDKEKISNSIVESTESEETKA